MLLSRPAGVRLSHSKPREISMSVRTYLEIEIRDAGVKYCPSVRSHLLGDLLVCPTSYLENCGPVLHVPGVGAVCFIFDFAYEVIGKHVYANMLCDIEELPNFEKLGLRLPAGNADQLSEDWAHNSQIVRRTLDQIAAALRTVGFVDCDSAGTPT